MGRAGVCGLVVLWMSDVSNVSMEYLAMAVRALMSKERLRRAPHRRLELC